MRKNSLIKLAGIALAAALAFTGCDSGGDGAVLGGGGGTAVTGGGTTTTTTTTSSTTGFGVTGGSLTGGFGGTGGGSGTSAATSTGTSSTSTTTGTGTGGGFLGNVNPTDARTGLNNPTSFAAVTISGQARVVCIDGFRLGANNGRLLVLDENGTFDPNTGGFPIIQITAAAGSPLSGVLSSPFDMVSTGNALYISVGFDQTNEGKIIRVDNFSQSGNTITARFTDITAGVPLPINPAYMTIVGGINADGTTRDYVYFTQYSPSGGGNNLVRRVSTDGVRGDIVVNNLNFPIGIDHDGFRLAICDADGGANGQVVLAPIQTTITTPLNAGDLNDVDIVQPASGQQAIARPHDVVYDGNNGFFYTEGGAVQSLTGPAALGTGNGAVRFIANNSTTAQLVNSGLTNCAGIDAIDPGNDGTTSVLFSEAIAINGRILRRSVDTTNVVSNVSPTVADTGINNPLSVGIADENSPLLISVINYIGGQNNGILRLYGP